MIKIGNNNFLTTEEIAEGFNVDIGKVYEILKEYNIKSIIFDGKGYVLENEFVKIFIQEPSIYAKNKYKENEKSIQLLKKKYFQKQ